MSPRLTERHLQGRGIPDQGSAAFLFLQAARSQQDKHVHELSEEAIKVKEEVDA